MNRYFSVVLHLVIYLLPSLVSPQINNSTAWATVLAAVLIWISVADFESLEIPDTASLLLVGIATIRLLTDTRLWPPEHLLAMVVWPGIMWLISNIFERFRAVEGLGFGDVKLMAGLGLWLGFSAVTWVVLLATVSATFALVIRSAIRKQPPREYGMSSIAFGPFLCFCSWAVWLLGAS